MVEDKISRIKFGVVSKKEFELVKMQSKKKGGIK